VGSWPSYTFEFSGSAPYELGPLLGYSCSRSIPTVKGAITRGAGGGGRPTGWPSGPRIGLGGGGCGGMGEEGLPTTSRRVAPWVAEGARARGPRWRLGAVARGPRDPTERRGPVRQARARNRRWSCRRGGPD